MLFFYLRSAHRTRLLHVSQQIFYVEKDSFVLSHQTNLRYFCVGDHVACPLVAGRGVSFALVDSGEFLWACYTSFPTYYRSSISCKEKNNRYFHNILLNLHNFAKSLLSKKKKKTFLLVTFPKHTLEDTFMKLLSNMGIAFPLPKVKLPI